MRVLKRPQFLLDFAEELLWLNEKAGSDVASDFRNATKETIHLLRAHPNIGRERTDLVPKGIRSWRVARFVRWLIFY
jgi:plasmid stabilization system protein ParE